MSLSRLILIGALVLPAAEIGCFVAVAGVLGIAKALLLLLGLSACGAVMVRRAGTAQLNALRRQFAPGGNRGMALDGRRLVFIAAGILLLVPGFITAVVGVALIALPLRALAWVFGAGWKLRQPSRRAPGVIDLDRGEWRVEAPSDGSSARGSKR